MFPRFILRKKTQTKLKAARQSHNRLLIASFFAALGALHANESGATVYYGVMTGSITGYTDITTDFFNGQNFSNWFFGDNRNPIGQSIEITFMVSDLYLNDGGPATPVINNSSDPAHYGNYTGYIGTSSGGGNLRGGQVLLGAKAMAQDTANFSEALINDLAPGDQFKWNTKYFENGRGILNTLEFSLTAQQNILNSGYTAQEFYWLASNDSTGIGTGSLLTSRYLPFQSNYTFAIDRLSLTLSPNPTPPAPVPLPAGVWFFGSTLLGLARIAQKRLS